MPPLIEQSPDPTDLRTARAVCGAPASSAVVATFSHLHGNQLVPALALVSGDVLAFTVRFARSSDRPGRASRSRSESVRSGSARRAGPASSRSRSWGRQISLSLAIVGLGLSSRIRELRFYASGVITILKAFADLQARPNSERISAFNALGVSLGVPGWERRLERRFLDRTARMASDQSGSAGESRRRELRR